MKTLKFFVRCTVLLALALCLTGCDSDNSGETAAMHLEVISGYHGNAPAPAVHATDVYEAVNNCAASYGSVTLIVADGDPYIAGSYDIQAPDVNLSKAKREQIAKDQTAQILGVLSTAKATTPEVDTLSAITLGARELADKSGEKHMLLLDSGLGTYGYVDFTKNLLRADSETVVTYLQEKQALPNLEGVYVTWVGIGDVAGEQEKLTPSNRNALISIWKGILNAAGATSVDILEGSYGCSLAEELPYVTPVEIIPDAPINIDLSEPLILAEDKVLFLPDSDVLANRDDAAATLKPIAEYMIDNPEFHIIIAGTTATVGSNEDCIERSFSRASAIKTLLTDMLVPADQITVVGLGYDHEYHVPDIDANGVLNDNASANRSVILFDAVSDAGLKLSARYQ